MEFIEEVMEEGPFEPFEELEIIGKYEPNKNYCIGVINISKLESIQYHKEGNEYHITISYIGSSQDSDGTLTINSFAGGDLRDHYGNDAAIETAIQKVISGITATMQSAYVSGKSNVVEYYPPFDLGTGKLRSTFSPYTRDNQSDPQDEMLKQIMAMLAGAHMG
tara:strand:+ start:3974 stop:4465 length:492 start_codon:yes stop_codon:yes gene_type:complete